MVRAVTVSMGRRCCLMQLYEVLRQTRWRQEDREPMEIVWSCSPHGQEYPYTRRSQMDIT